MKKFKLRKVLKKGQRPILKLEEVEVESILRDKNRFFNGKTKDKMELFFS